MVSILRIPLRTALEIQRGAEITQKDKNQTTNILAMLTVPVFFIFLSVYIR